MNLEEAISNCDPPLPLEDVAELLKFQEFLKQWKKAPRNEQGKRLLPEFWWKYATGKVDPP